MPTTKTIWIREFDGGRYVSDDGRIVLTLTSSVGKFAYMRNYAVKVDGASVGAARLLKDAKMLGIDRRDLVDAPRCPHVSGHGPCQICDDPAHRAAMGWDVLDDLFS